MGMVDVGCSVAVNLGVGVRRRVRVAVGSAGEGVSVGASVAEEASVVVAATCGAGVMDDGVVGRRVGVAACFPPQAARSNAITR